MRHPSLWLGDAQPIEQRSEPRPLLGLVDRIQVGTEQRDPRGDKPLGEIEWRLAAELHESRQWLLPGRGFGFHHTSH